MPSGSSLGFTMKNATPTNIAMSNGQSSSEQFLNEAKYWIEQELVARSLSLLLPVEEVKRPDPSGERVPLLAQHQEENWLMGIIGVEGAKLFMEAGTSVDEELVFQLVKEVISEQAIARILASRKLDSKQESMSDTSLEEPPSQSYSKESFVSDSDSKSEELNEDNNEKPKQDQPLDTPEASPIASPVNSHPKEVHVATIEVLPQFILESTPTDRPVTPTLSETASEDEPDKRLPGGGLLESEDDPMHLDGTNPTSHADTPPATPPSEPIVPSSPLNQVPPPTTPIFSSISDSSTTEAAPHASVPLWNQETQTSPRVAPPGNSDRHVEQTDEPFEHPLPQQTASLVDQAVGSSAPPSIETINGGIEDVQVDFDLSEGEWLMYQHQVQRLLPFARYVAQHSSAQFNISHGSGGSMDNSLLDTEEIEQDPLSEGEIPLSFSPQWVTSMLALISELQSTGQVLGPSASSDAAFIAAARSLVTGSTSRLPSPGEVLTPHAISHNHSCQPPANHQLSTASHTIVHLASNSTTGVSDHVHFSYPEGFTRRQPVPLVTLNNDDHADEDFENNTVLGEQPGPAELSFLSGTMSSIGSGVRVPYLEPLVSEGEVRPSVVPNFSHQSEPNHSQSSIEIEPVTTLKRSSSTPSFSAGAGNLRRFARATPSSRSHAVAPAVMTSATTPAESATTLTTVSQPLLAHRDSSACSRPISDYTRSGNEALLVMGGHSFQQPLQSQIRTSAAIASIATEGESDLRSPSGFTLAAAREETSISLPHDLVISTRQISTRDRDARSRRTSLALPTATSGEGNINGKSVLKDKTDSSSKMATEATQLSPGQVSSPNPSPPPGRNVSTSRSASEGEARLR